MRRWRIAGTAAAVQAALDRMLVRVDVRGVVEGERCCEVAFAGAAPDLADVTIEELPVDVPEVTGFENDAPIFVGDRLVVRPPWVAAPPNFAGLELVVPRGMAFGSGEHESTQAAMLAMLELFAGHPAASVADVGTGSGILALLARRLGCTAILACDIEPASVAAAQELLPDARVVRGGPAALGTQVDAVVANLRGSELAACRDELLALWNGRGPCVLSGLLADEVDPARSWFAAAPAVERAVGRFTALGYAPSRCESAR